MLTNAYDTTVGQPYRATDRVESTIKTLHLSRNLVPTKKANVFTLTNDSELPIPVFAFPITLQALNRNMITVYDERPYRNKSNAIVHSNEITIARLAAFLQQDVAENYMTPLKNCRLLATKAFSEAVSARLIRGGGLDLNESLTLKVLLAYYFLSLQENPSEDVTFIGVNVIRSIFGTEKGYILGVIEDLPRMPMLPDLLAAIHNNPILYKLKTVGLKDFIGVVGGISFASMGNKVIAAAAEAPCLFTALVYGVTRFKVYGKTQLGVSLDPKYNKGVLEAFTKAIDYTYDLT